MTKVCCDDARDKTPEATYHMTVKAEDGSTKKLTSEETTAEKDLGVWVE